VATIRYVPVSPGQDPAERKVPDDLEPRPSDRGIEWFDEDGAKHVVPWSAILEFIGPPEDSDARIVTPSVEAL
jgi:hypothetical protein